MEILGERGRYELRAPIGQGAVCSVFEAMDLRRRVPVIVKRFAPSADLKAYAEVVAALKRADVPGVILPQELVLSRDPAPFAVYPVVVGESLESAIRGGAMQWVRAEAIVSGCATILAAVAKATGYTHRALKPANVWLTPEGAPRILDFGRALLGPSEPVRRGDLLLEYRAPEQLGAPGDARADVFTLAVLLVELTTGVHPFSGITAFQAAHKLTQTPPDLAELTRRMSSAAAHEVATHVRRALAVAVAERPADVRAFAATLDYQRPRVGSPSPIRPARPVASARPDEPVHPVEDPSTVMQLPNMWQRLTRPSTGTSPLAEPGTSGPPMDLARRGDPLPPAFSNEHVQEDMPQSPGVPEPASKRREVGGAAGELDVAPQRAQSPSPGPTSASSRQLSGAELLDLVERTERDPDSPVRALDPPPDATLILPSDDLPLRAPDASSSDRGAWPSDHDTTEMRTRVSRGPPLADEAATAALPQAVLRASPLDDTTLQLPEVAPVLSVPPEDEATLQLPDASTDQRMADVAPVPSAPPRALAPAELDRLSIRMLRVATILIGLSILCLLVVVLVLIKS